MTHSTTCIKSFPNCICNRCANEDTRRMVPCCGLHGVTCNTKQECKDFKEEGKSMIDNTALQAAIAYFEDAVRESDEIIEDCSPDLQRDLTEQKAHFVVAIAAMRRAEPANESLTLDQLRGMNGEPVWCVDAKGRGIWALVHTRDEVCTDADFGDWEFYCYGWRDGEKLNENGWLAYKRKVEARDENQSK